MKRIQISRQHKDPSNTKRCTRPGKWGNDFKMMEIAPCEYENAVRTFFFKNESEWNESASMFDWGNYFMLRSKIWTPHEAVRLYKAYQLPTYSDDELRELLEYENLGCWCRIGNQCHVDALIEEIKRRKLI